MAKELKGGVRVEAAEWLKGKIMCGYFIEKEKLPDKNGKKGSMKYVFALEELGGGKLAAIWGTGALDYTMGKATAGNFYRVECKGKEKDEKIENPIWTFSVQEAENQAEVDAWKAEYRSYVAGGGK
jgi:hypothetical protein